MNVLFVCSKNRWRSPTAEKMFADHDLLRVRSAGTSRSAVRTISAGDLHWADTVIAMEPKHLSRLRADYPGETQYLEMHCVDIPDEYKFMDPELQDLIADAVARIFPDCVKRK
ncbi:MAG: phosphotyrosine protein phosphatase [Planctomycetota bacterium]